MHVAFRFGFHKSWSTDATTMFILNLAFSDFLYCGISLPLYAMQYFSKRWPLGLTECKIFAAIRYMNAFADWMSLGLVAVSRCMGMVQPIWNEKYMSGLNGLAIIVAIWLYALFLVTLPLTGVSNSYDLLPTEIITKWILKLVGQFGYNCLVGKCDFIKEPGSLADPNKIFYTVV